MRLHTSFSAFALVAAVAGAGCYPDRLDTTNYDVVATVRDTTTVFKTATTFSIRDSIVHPDVGLGQDPISHALDTLIVNSVRTHMVANGYTEDPDSSTANLILLVAVSTTEYQGYYWSDWCGYYGWYYPYCWYYPPYWGSYSYTAGSLFVVMADNRGVSGSNPRPLVWMGVGNGLVTGNTPNLNRMTNAIDQMFAQSPYLDKN